MAGQVTVRVELKDGTTVEVSRFWSGGNSIYEGAEAQEAAKVAMTDVREMIDSTRGSVGDNPTSALMSWPGKPGMRGL
jgi:hypothetical protein